MLILELSVALDLRTNPLNQHLGWHKLSHALTGSRGVTGATWFRKARDENVSLKTFPGNDDLDLAVADEQRFGWGFIAGLKDVN